MGLAHGLRHWFSLVEHSLTFCFSLTMHGVNQLLQGALGLMPVDHLWLRARTSFPESSLVSHQPAGYLSRLLEIGLLVWCWPSKLEWLFLFIQRGISQKNKIKIKNSPGPYKSQGWPWLHCIFFKVSPFTSYFIYCCFSLNISWNYFHIIIYYFDT